MNVVLLLMVGVAVAAVFGWGAVRALSVMLRPMLRIRTGGAGVVTLACPHCRKQTRADRHECEHCHYDL